MARWDYQDIAYESIDKEKIASNALLFKVLAIASFIEITSDLYERNLIRFYEGDEEITEWLSKIWEPEEIQHGKALRAYVAHVWPEFDWQKAYESFRERYGPLCTLDEFQPTRAGEMLARMVVETGTSTLYRALERYATDLDEPILAQIAANISKDEVYHYDRFEKGFVKYNATEKMGRSAIVKIIYARLKEVNDEDVYIAFTSIEPDGDFETFRKEMKAMAQKYYPYKMAVKMLMRPLRLNRHLENVTASSVEGALRILGI